MLLNPYLAQLQSLAVPLAIAAAIVVFSALSFRAWASRIGHARQAMQQLNALMRDAAGASRDVLQQAHRQTTDPGLQFLLRETEAGLIDLPSAQASTGQPHTGVQSYSFRSHADTWELRSVLGGRLNLSLFETMPNLLIGFGLMCTFIFLAVALQQAGLALNALDVSARQQDQALQALIATAGGKFITSIAGLLCSLLWNWRAKVALESLQTSIDTFCHTLRARVPDNAAEASVRLQLALFQDMLSENRAQVVQLRRLEDHFADTVGDALARHMQPAFDTLGVLADSIQHASQRFGHAGSQAADELGKAGEVLTQGIQHGLSSFNDAVATLAHTVQTTRHTVSELDAALARATTAGTQGTQQLGQLLSQFGHTITTVENAMGGLQTSVTQIHHIAGSFKDSASAIEQSVGLQRAAAQDFKDALVPMNQALGHTVQTLQASAESADTALGHVRTHLQEAQQALSGTVTSLTDGVSAYSSQIAELHTKLDQHLASAVNQLGGSITNLEEVLDEFIDALPIKPSTR